MPETYPRPQLHQSRPYHRFCGPGRNLQPRGGPPDQHRISGRLGRHQLHEPLGPGSAGPRTAAGSSPRPGGRGDSAVGNPNPPASCSGVSHRGSSSSASGLPRVSAMIRSLTCVSSGPVRTDSSSDRLSSSSRPPTTSPGSPASSAPGCRAANTSPTGSGGQSACDKPEDPRRGPVQPLLVVHHATSRGSRSAASESRLENRQGDQKGVGDRSGADAERDAQRVTLRCGEHGHRPSRARTVDAGRRRQSMSDWSPAVLETRHPGAFSIRWSSSAVLPRQARPAPPAPGSHPPGQPAAAGRGPRIRHGAPAAAPRPSAREDRLEAAQPDLNPRPTRRASQSARISAPGRGPCGADRGSTGGEGNIGREA